MLSSRLSFSVSAPPKAFLIRCVDTLSSTKAHVRPPFAVRDLSLPSTVCADGSEDRRVGTFLLSSSSEIVPVSLARCPPTSVTASDDVISSQSPSVASIKKRKVDFVLAGLLSSIAVEGSLWWVTTGTDVTYGGVFSLAGGMAIGKLFPAMNTLFKLYVRIT